MKKYGYYLQPKSLQLLSKYDRWRSISKLLNLSKAARLRLEWFIWYEEHSKNVSLTCRHFGIARKTWYRWQKRFNQLNLRSLEELSRAPLHVRKPAYTELEVQRINILRKHYPTAGREKLSVLYLDDFAETIKDWSVRRIVHDKKLYAKRALHKKRSIKRKQGLKKKRITELIKEPHLGFLMESDTIVEYWNNEKRYILTAIDHYSRIAFARMYHSKASKNAADFLRRIVLLLDGNLKNLHIDNGSEFKGEFEQAAEALNIPLYHARPYRPKDKPFIERFNGIIQQEYIDLGNFTLDVDCFNEKLINWLIYYNFKRPHHSLAKRRPMEVAILQQSQVLPMYSPMTKG